MRPLGFSKKWDKLQQDVFTTFRFTRKDRDWEVGEVVMVVYKPRSKGGGERLGVARIINKEIRNMVKVLAEEKAIPTVSEEEANLDGFKNYWQMWGWLFDTYGGQRLLDEPMNKLTLIWG